MKKIKLIQLFRVQLAPQVRGTDLNSEELAHIIMPWLTY
jgi:hypothetical protein